MQVQTLMHDRPGVRGAPRHAAAALVAIVREAGPLGLFKGYWATNCVWLPWNVLYIALYEGARRSARRVLGREEGAPLPAAATMASGFAAACVATVATHPPDVVKTRLQVRMATGRAPEGHRAWLQPIGACVSGCSGCNIQRSFHHRRISNSACTAIIHGLRDFC